jgi:opacity protein-like surface antigen
MKKTAALLLAATVCTLAPSLAQAQAPADRWTFSVAPYLWLPSLDGKLNYGPPSAGGATPTVSVDADTLLDNLDFAFMGMGQARKGRWLVATDVIYLDFGGADSAVRSVDFNPGPGPVNVSTTGLNAGTNTDLKGWVWTLAGGYALIEGPRTSLDLLAGFRYLDLETSSDWQLTTTVAGPAGAATFARSGNVSRSEDVWMGIVGAKGRVKLGEGNWFANYYADVGGSGSIFTWQGMAGVGYAFKWGDLVLDYRYLYFSQDGERLIDNVSFGGFALGANFKF